MKNAIYLVAPNDIQIDRESSPHTATVRDADDKPVLTVSASLPDEEILHAIDTFNLVYGQGFKLSTR
ncbi:hypothetical protein [Pseudomonas coronafaciens]|uniref:hypothetical protein n=1 Tax=Pseudomonas coronafaciens TaxID=53409 RepID=UPI000E3BF025|nr:hypothetical protein [Pseudomonas coronafaciens]